MQKSVGGNPTSVRPEAHERIEEGLFRVLKALVFRHDPSMPFDEMPISQVRCLHVIAEREGSKMAEVAHALEIKLPATSQIVHRLVKRGLVARDTDPSDRRVVRLRLTAAARDILDVAQGARAARMDATLSLLAAEEIQRVGEALALLAGAAERADPPPDAVESETESPADPSLGILSLRAGARTRRGLADLSPSRRVRRL